MRVKRIHISHHARHIDFLAHTQRLGQMGINNTVNVSKGYYYLIAIVSTTTCALIKMFEDYTDVKKKSLYFVKTEII